MGVGMNFSQTTRRQFIQRAAQITAARLAVPALLGAADAKGDYQIGCFTRPWAAFDWRLAFDEIAAAGFKHVGLMTTNSPSKHILSQETTIEQAQKVGEEAKQRGLGIPSAWGGDLNIATSSDGG